MEIGRWNKLPHYYVSNNPTNFYVYVNEDGYGSSSRWIKGKEAFKLYGVLKSLFRNKAKFIEEVKRIHNEYKKQ